MTEHNYQHVLFAAALTDEDLQVGARAVAVARAHGAKLSLLHILEERDVGAGAEAGPLTPYTDSGLAQRMRDELADLARHLGMPEAEVAVVRANAVGTKLDQVAQERGVDLIVVGSHATHGWTLLLGSKPNEVLHHAPCDVLAVRLKR